MRVSWILAGALLVSQADAWAPTGLSARPMGARLPLRAASASAPRSGRLSAPVMMSSPKAKSATEALRMMEEKQKMQVTWNNRSVAPG